MDGWRDGLPADVEAALPPAIRAFGAFTTVGCDHGRPLLYARHLERLRASLEHLQPGLFLRLPSRRDATTLLDQVGLQGPARLRVVASLVEGGDRWSVEGSVSACRAVGPGAPPLLLLPQRWSCAPPLAGHKTLARLPWELARRRARGHGCDDAVLVDARERVLESAVANLFFVFGRTAATPPAPRRCLPGLMRRWLVGALPQLGLEVEERDVKMDEALTADEVWASNCVAGVVRVAGIGDRRWRRWRLYRRLPELGVPAPGWPPGR